ncbi:MAG: ISNCY family transposase [Desulfobacterales bacterium]|nr:ISNCY family transposase [Desulfobacterales bacterium]
MGQKQLQRWHLMKMVEVGKITLKEAGERIGVSYRQAKRIGRAIRERGMKGLVHGNRGRPSNHRIEESLRKKVLELSKEIYWDFNDTHFTEKLRECEGIDLNRETVRKLRREAGMAPKRRRRGPKHRKRRERKAQEGWMVLWDGSPHPWFGRDHPPCCLMAAIDDATGKLLAARFFPFEGSAGYLWLLKEMVQKYGIPMIIYQDRHGALHRNDSHWSLEEQLAGRQEPTQVGLALEALGIQSISALSPQAKGRVEKLFATLQDRLGAELRLKGMVTMEEGNRFLQPTFLNAFNRRFAVKPRESQKAWREVPNHLDLDRIISFRYTATVGNDNTARLGGWVLDIPPGPQRRSYAKLKVEARQLLNGSWRIYAQDQLIAKHSPTSLKEPLRALPRNKHHAKGVKDYHWVYLASAPSREGDPYPLLIEHR